MIRNLLIDALALVGIFAMVFIVLFIGYGFSDEYGLGLYFSNSGGYYWQYDMGGIDP